MSNLKWVMLTALLSTSMLASCQNRSGAEDLPKKEVNAMHKIEKSEEEWKQKLSPEEYRVLREKGTERAFTGKYNEFKDDGTFTCAACGNELFSSDSKYDSGSGWPSFYQAIDKNALNEETDRSHGMDRTEVMCNDCGGHLGHVFPDGPEPTGMRYCINSASLDFKSKK